MPNNLSLSSAQPQKQTRFAPIFTSRFFSGLWTNRSSLRDATTSRIVEKFYGQAGDAIIAGSNIEITNKLTFARRPGTSIYDSHSYNSVDRFYGFRLFNANTEQIILMIDQANILYSLSGGVRTDVFDKSAGSGQTYMQSNGNTLYFANGVDNKKWLQTLFNWTASTSLVTAATPSPFYNTYMFDANGNILQLVGTTFPITGTTLNASTTTTQYTVTITSSIALDTRLIAGQIITFPAVMVATYLENQSSTIISISGTSMIVTYPLPTVTAPTTTVETATGFCFNGGLPVTGSTRPGATGGGTFGANYGVSAVTVAFGSSTVSGLTIDGSAMWVSRSNAFGPVNGVENWGIDNSKPSPIVPIISETNPLGLAGTPVPQIPLYVAGTVYPANTYVVDSNNNVQFTTAGGTAGTAAPTWSQILNQNTTDNTITWTLVYLGALSTFLGGYRYGVAIVNSLDNTVSNILPLSDPTGNFTGAQGIFIPAGSGLESGPNTGISIDPQGDYVAIFRTTDGQSTPFLIPGQNGQTWTLPLGEYMALGYNDTTPDTGLNNLISGPISNENTPPAIGAINLTFQFGRIFYSIGNVVYWTSGPSTPVGNGLNGNAPLNFSEVPSLVKRLVPSSAGILVFTVSDVYIIQGTGTTSSPISAAIPLLPGIGLSSYNALDTNGPMIGLFTTDNQFITIDPSSGVSYTGLPIGDQLRLTNGNPGTNWNPANVYVAWHVQGEDQGWYLCDGSSGWYRLMSTPAPESGQTWSPFATITGGVQAVQSIEVTPGVHKLLLGPTGTGNILQRDLSVFSDNGVAYPAQATIGSLVLTQPGQVAEIPFIVTDSVKTGTPLTLGFLGDEALPYYTGPIDILKRWVTDPPNFPVSNSLYSQRFYLSELEDEAAAVRHCQIQIIFSPFDTVQNELLTLTIFGAFSQEI